MKNWYSKERLEDFKRHVENGLNTQEEYDLLEKQMKTFNLDDNEIVNKIVDYFLSIEPKTEVDFTRLIYNYFSINPLVFFDDRDLFDLYHKFEKECKKRKIKIVHHKYKGPVGLPYNLGFWRVLGPIITKVVYNLSNGFSDSDDIYHRTYIVFENHMVTYCHEPLEDDFCDKDNCIIKISYDPSYENSNYDDEENDNYDFDDICAKVKSLAKSHEISLFLNHTYGSIEIFNDEDNIKVNTDLSSDETKEFDLLFRKYMPNSFKRFCSNK